jgi:hypothetical protein
MSTVIQTRNSAGKIREHFVSLPLVTVLLDEKLKYFTRSDDGPATPAPGYPAVFERTKSIRPPSWDAKRLDRCARRAAAKKARIRSTRPLLVT